MKFPGIVIVTIVAGVALLAPEIAIAARINELSDSTFLDRAARFFTFRDPSLRNALIGSMLLGVCCGLMGAFLVVRKLSLLGDALSHAVLAWGGTWVSLEHVEGSGRHLRRRDACRAAWGRDGPTLARDHTHKEDARSGLCACLVLRRGNLPFYDDPEPARREQERAGQVHVRPGGGARERAM